MIRAFVRCGRQSASELRTKRELYNCSSDFRRKLSNAGQQIEQTNKQTELKRAPKQIHAHTQQTRIELWWKAFHTRKLETLQSALRFWAILVGYSNGPDFSGDHFCIVSSHLFRSALVRVDRSQKRRSEKQTESQAQVQTSLFGCLQRL